MIRGAEDVSNPISTVSPPTHMGIYFSLASGQGGISLKEEGRGSQVSGEIVK